MNHDSEGKMTIEVDTKDCTALSDAELGEMADISAEGPAGFDVGFLSKQREEWVLVTQSRESGRLHGFLFSTLERIGGTPAMLVGLASVKSTARRGPHLRALMGDLYRRAVLAFPDEDVLVGTRMIDAAGFQAFQGLEDIVPSPGHRASGEERAWGRRLAKRFGAEGRIDDRTFVLAGDGLRGGVLEFQALKPESVPVEVAGLFSALDTARHDSLVTFGWAMAEDLATAHVGR